MKERQILMTPDNAQKIFDGVKTQTRRIMNPQPSWVKERTMYWKTKVGMIHTHKCPYGAIGDRLWIREAWQEKAWSLTELNRAGFLSAPRKPHETYLNQDLYAIHKGGYNKVIGDPGKWTPSLRMPRWACRTVVEITQIRVQRVQEISEEDAKAEGCKKSERHPTSYRVAFAELWASINGADSWDANPWVWAITFKQVKP